MLRGSVTRATLLALCSLTALAPSPALAEGAASSPPPSAAPALANDDSGAPASGDGADSARAQFDQALALYRAGQYAAALEHLQNAAKLDPAGKDLFFNLALVHEKLGHFADAIAALERFRQLEPDPVERERARLSIERLRGAAEANKATSAAAPCPAPAQPALPEKARASSPWKSPLLVGTASLAAVSLVVGVVFGAKALSDDVGGVSTSPELSLQQLRERGRRAEREALVADIAFALSVASAGTFAGVWLATPSGQGRGAGITLRSYF